VIDRTSALPVYPAYGMRIASAVPLPVEPVEPGPADLVVEWGPTQSIAGEPPPGVAVAHQELGGRRRYTISADDDGFVLRFHGACEMVISTDLRRVECRPDPSVDRELVGVLFLGTTMAFVLDRAGRHVLHGSAVARHGRVIGFVGRSGAGKSTVAALSCMGEATLVSDDVIPVDTTDGTARCVGAWPELRLRTVAAPELTEALRGQFTARTTVDGRVALADPRPTPMPMEIAALVVPRPAHGRTDIALARIPAGEASLVVLTTGRIENWDRPEDRRRQFLGATAIVRAVPVLTADIGWGPPFVPRIGEHLLDEVERLVGPN
jgi:hypothetical protein